MPLCLAIAPEHDDNEWRVGGTLMRLMERGWEVVQVVLNGWPCPDQADNQAWFAEGMKAAAAIGTEKIMLPYYNLKMRDEGRLNEITDAIRQIVIERRPQLVIGQWPQSANESHRVTAAVTLDVLKHLPAAARPAEVWLYDAYEENPAWDFLVDVSSYWDRIVPILDIYLEGFSARFFKRPNGNSLVLTRSEPDFTYRDGEDYFEHIERFRVVWADPNYFTRAAEWLGKDSVRFVTDRLPVNSLNYS